MRSSQFSEFPLSVQTVYADLQAMVLRSDTPGIDPDLAEVEVDHSIGVTSKTIKGTVYWYAQYVDREGKRQQTYLGRDGDEKTMERVEWIRSEKDRTAFPQRRQSVKMLRAAGYAAPNRHASGALAVLARTGVFHGGAVLVGTPAYGAILNRLGFQEKPISITADVDISVNHVCLSIPEIVDIGEALRQWNPRMSASTMLDHRDPPTSFALRGMDFAVDFLTPGLLDQEGRPKLLPRLKFAAAQMPFLDYLVAGAVPTLVLTPPGLIVPAPDAGRFMLHKFAVAIGRPHALEAKRRKDLHQAVTLHAILREIDARQISEAVEAARSALEAAELLDRVARGIEMGSNRLGLDLGKLRAEVEHTRMRKRKKQGA